MEFIVRENIGYSIAPDVKTMLTQAQELFDQPNLAIEAVTKGDISLGSSKGEADVNYSTFEIKIGRNWRGKVLQFATLYAAVKLDLPKRED